MTIAVEAIYESGVLKPVRPLTELKEKDKVLLRFETPIIADRLLTNPIQIDPHLAREIAEDDIYEFSFLRLPLSKAELENDAKAKAGESIVDRQRRERLALESEDRSDLMNNREHDLF